jgi:hypothetical protein
MLVPVSYRLIGVTSAKKQFLLEVTSHELEGDRILVVGEADWKNNRRISCHIKRARKANQPQEIIRIFAQCSHFRNARCGNALRRNSEEIDVAEYGREAATIVVTTLENLVVVSRGLLQSEFYKAGKNRSIFAFSRRVGGFVRYAHLHGGIR